MGASRPARAGLPLGRVASAQRVRRSSSRMAEAVTWPSAAMVQPGFARMCAESLFCWRECPGRFRRRAPCAASAT
eukprot:10163668-Lingulodinium_polyedra.AAC.1